VRSLVS
jgi:hypothetical protein